MKLFTFFLLFHFFLNQNLSAQKTILSLSNCIDRSKKNSYLINAGEKKTEAAQKRYQRMRSQSLPQIAGEMSSSYHRLEPYSFNQNSVLLTADWSLGDFFLNTARLAKQDKLIAEKDEEQQHLDVSLRCALLYIHILQQQERDELLQQRLALLDAHYNVAKALWQSGNRTQFDLLQTDAEINRLKEDITYLEIDHQNFLQELGQLINDKNAGEIELQRLETEQICNQQLPEFSAETMKRIPVLESFDLQINAQQIYTRTVTAQQLPHLNWAGGFMQDGDPTGDGDYWLLGIGIAFPLFRWNVSGLQKQQSTALQQALNFQKQETERDITITINRIRNKMTKLKDVIQLQNQRLSTTENAYKIAEANYQAGLMTNLEYLSAQQQLNETRIAIQETQLAYVSELVQYYIITNQPDKIAEL